MSDSLSFQLPFHNSILLVPLTPISRSTYNHYASIIRSFHRIRLSDIPPDPRGERATMGATPRLPGHFAFRWLGPGTNVQAGSGAGDQVNGNGIREVEEDGSGVEEGITSATANTFTFKTAGGGMKDIHLGLMGGGSYEKDHAYLEEFQSHRKLMGVIGICSARAYPTTEALASASREFDVVLGRLGLAKGVLAKRLWAFDPDEGHVDEGVEGVVVVPNVGGGGDSRFYIERLLADVAAEILYEFSNMAASLDSRTSLLTPREVAPAKNPFDYLPPKETASSSISSYTGTSTPPISPSPQSQPQPQTNGTSATTQSTAGSHPPSPSATPGPGTGQTANRQPQPQLNISSALAAPPQSRTALGIGGHQSGNQEGYLYGRKIQSKGGFAVSGTVPAEGDPLGPGGGATVLGTADAKARKKIAGRVKKLEGDLWCLAGRIGDGIACYTEAVALTKALSDNAWQAASLEALVQATVMQMVLKAQENAPAEHIPYITSKHAGKLASEEEDEGPDHALALDLIEKYTQAVSLYQKSLPPIPTAVPAIPGWSDAGASSPTTAPTTAPGPSTAQTPYPIPPDSSPPLVFFEACLRCAKLQLAIWRTEGWTDETIALLIESGMPGAPPTPMDESNPPLSLLARRLSIRGPVQHAIISQILAAAYTPHLSYLKIPDRMRILSGIASGYGSIGYLRKQSIILTELAAIAAEAVSRTRPPVTATEMNGHVGDEQQSHAETSDVSSARVSSGRKGNIIRSSHESTGNESILAMVDKACEALGIVVVGRLRRGYTVPIEGHRRALSGADIALKSDGEVMAKDHFGWPEIQVAMLKDCITMAEILPDHQGLIRFTITALRSLSNFMQPMEQLRLSQSIPRVFAAAMRRGDRFELEYWGPQDLLMSIEVVPLSPSHHPIERSLNEAKIEQSSSQATGPRFLYNPKKVNRSSAVHPVLVQNETAEFFVTLQNPFLFDLEIQSIELSTSGIAFTSHSLSTSIPPASFHTIRLSGVPTEIGTLSVRGCKIRVAGSPVRDFDLPIWSDEEEVKRQKHQSLDTRRDRVKATGLDHFHASEEKAPVRSIRYLACKVVPEQPLIRIRSTSLTHGALMLYDGEESTIRLILENPSSFPVDFLRLSFQDSYSTSMRTYLAENDTTPGDAHEIESDLAFRPVFTYDESKLTSGIQPGQQISVDVRCLGKLGCSTGVIQIDYAYVGRPVVESSSIFYTRQIFCDVFMSVHRTLSAQDMDIYRLKGFNLHRSRSAGRRGSFDGMLEESLRKVEDGKHCLFTLDVCNVYSQAFEVVLETVGNDSQLLTVRQRIEPGATASLLLRMDRLLLNPKQSMQPIPSVVDRQFVVSKVAMTAREDRISKELFWYREELLKKIKATWREVGTMRTGSISLRGLRLTKPMLNVLRIDDVDIRLSLETPVQSKADSGPDGAGAGAGSKVGNRTSATRFSARSNERQTLVLKIANHSARPIHLLLRIDLLPPCDLSDSCSSSSNAASHRRSQALSAMTLDHLSRNILMDGVNKFPLPKPLEPGDEFVRTVPVTFLAAGRFEFGVVGEEMEIKRKKGDGQEKKEGEEARERNVFVARDVVVIDVDR